MSKATDWTASKPRDFIGNSLNPKVEAWITLRGYCMVSDTVGREVAICPEDAALLGRWMLDTFGN